MMLNFAFDEVFHSPYEEFQTRRGEPFIYLRQLDPDKDEVDEEVGPMFRIRFYDGIEIDAWPEEVLRWDYCDYSPVAPSDWGTL